MARNPHAATLPVNPDVRAALVWWRHALLHQRGRSFPRRHDPTTDPVLYTDASLGDWGGLLVWPDGSRWAAYGTWPETQHLISDDISMLELACVAILCENWKAALEGTVTLVRCDNMAAVHCIRRGFCGSIRMARVLAPLFSSMQPV